MRLAGANDPARRRLTLALPVIAGLVAIVTLLVGTYAAVTYSHEVQARHADLRRHVDVEADQLAEALALPMWNLDLAHMRGVLASGLGESDIVAVEAITADQRVLLARDDAQRVLPRDQLPDDPSLLQVERLVRHGQQVIGRVRLRATPAGVARRLAEERGSLLRLVGLLDAGVVLGVGVLLWALVLRPVAALDRYAARVRAGEQDAQPEPVRYPGELGALRDSIGHMVAAQHAAQDDVRSLNAQLEQRVADRTGELAAALDAGNRARDQAELATRAKSEFLANMSHELRTPMNAVLGLTDLALRGPLEPRQRDYLVRAHGAADALLALLNGLLDFSRIEAGKLEIHRDVFHLDALLQRVASVVGVRAHEKGLALRVGRDPDVPDALVGDALRLEQVLVNLAGNAVKFTARGDVTVHVSRVASAPAPAPAPDQDPDPPADPSPAFRFSVRDTGIGIRPELRERLFQPFDQLDGSTTRQYGGTGLGLAISHHLVGLMGGRMSVDSTPEVGSEFAFVVPLDEAALAAPMKAQVPAPTASPGPGAAATSAALPSGRILLVEDNELNQMVATELLKIVSDTDVSVAADGDQALRLLREAPFDLVLMDVQMPGMDGYEVTRRIRQDLALRVPVVAMTAHARAEDRDRCLAAGMDDFVAKPFEPEELAAVVARWLVRPSA